MLRIICLHHSRFINDWLQLCSTRQHKMDKSKFLVYCCVVYFIVTMMSVHCSIAAADNDDIEPIVGGKNPITDEQELSDLVDRVKKNFKQFGDTENGPNLEFIRLKSAEYRVVAGFIYTLDAEINENEVKTDCTIEVWEKPWLDFVKLDVECGEEKRKYQWKSREDPDELPSTAPTLPSTSNTTTTTPSSETVPTNGNNRH